MKTTPATRFLSPVARLLFMFLLALGVSSASLASSSFFVSVAIAPPPLPVYVQPICPGPGYIWIPGYWAYAPDGYYWVPGYWELAPFVGAYWTPGWWGWSNGAYLWHAGYWGPRIGFYGGIDYGFGYFGVGYAGGYWSSGAFHYNTAVSNVNVTIVNNTYNQPVAGTANVARVSYNGGTGGITAQPTAGERLAMRDRHRAPTSMQVQHERLARADRGQLASVNHGTPTITATPKVADFRGRGTAAGSAANGGVPTQAQNGRPPTQAQKVRPPTQAQTTRPQTQAQTHAQSVPHPPQTQGTVRAAPPQAQRGEARVEHGAPHVSGGAPRPPNATTAKPELHAQRAPRPETHAQVVPHPEMHAQAAPQGPGGAPRAESRGGHQGGQRHEEGGQGAEGRGGR